MERSEESGLRVQFPCVHLKTPLLLRMPIPSHPQKMLAGSRPRNHLVTFECGDCSIQSATVRCARQAASPDSGGLVGVPVPGISTKGGAGIELAADTDAHL